MNDNAATRVWETFLALEEKHQLNEFTVANIPVWDYVRFFVYNHILNSKGIHYPTVSAEIPAIYQHPLAFRAQRLLKRIYHTLKYPPVLLRKYDYLFINSANSRRVLNNENRYMDIWCDPVIDHLGCDNCLVIENFNLPLGYSHLPVQTKNVISSEQITLAIHQTDKSTPAIIPNDSEMALIDGIERDFFSHFNIDINLKSYWPAIFSQLQKSLALTHLLHKIKPKAVFLVCSYGKEGYISACKKAGIPVIELQHGTISRQHAGYAYPHTSRKKTFPDAFFSFGQFWLKTTSLPLPDSNCFSVGYPYLSTNSNQFNIGNKKQQILFISQWSIGNELAIFASKLATMLPSNWSILYKLHPAEQKNWISEHPCLQHEMIEVITDNSIPLYKLMADSRIQIGVYSTALFEGLAFGCKTFLVNLPGIGHMQALVDEGFAVVVNAAEEINFSDADSTHNTDQVFARNWQANFDSALSKCTG